ncbi:MAG: TolC family protein [Pirellulales bacterium]|nr:TolC family protein [Pirellulales bacterium]
MSRRPPILHVVLCLWLIVAIGCQPQQPFYLFEDGDLSHYKGMATDIEVPDADIDTLADVCKASAPLTLKNTEPTEIWELSLEEAVQTALANSKVMRSLGAVAGDPDSLTRAADAVPTIYDPSRVETNPRFGTEAALAAFDAQLGASVFWEKNDTPMNVDNQGSMFFPVISQEDNGTFQAKLSKTNVTGGTTSISHNWQYSWSNSPIRRWPSNWNADITAEFRQPLLQGAGVQFNRIAGPGAIAGYNNGIVIARLRTDVALADFEAAVRNLVRDVEQAYWSLNLAYRELDSVISGRDSALETWRKIHSLFELGARGGEAEKEAQARRQYFLFLAQVEERLSLLYAAETQLRYMMGIAATDGRLIRPSDEPTWAKISFDWQETQCEALARNVDLRRQKWRVKEKEMELIAAKNYVLPRLDAVGLYKWLGMGHDLISTDRKNAIAADQFDNAFQSMTSGDFQGWQLGMEFSMPIGFRKELAGVRHAQLNLVRERALLREQELEVSHQLTAAIRDLDRGIVLSRTNFNGRIAAKKEVESVEAAYDNGTVTLDLLLQAQRRLAEAEIAFYRSIIEYNLAIVDVHYRKGSLLEYNGVYLAEGPWPGKAYFDARRRARARDAGHYLDYGFTRPQVISRGSYNQHQGPGVCPTTEMQDMQDIQPKDLKVEPIPTPAPEVIPSPDAPLSMPPAPKPGGVTRAVPAPQVAPEPLVESLPDTNQSAQADVKQLAGLFGTSAKVIKLPATDTPAAGVQPVSYEQTSAPLPNQQPKQENLPVTNPAATNNNGGTAWKSASKPFTGNASPAQNTWRATDR